MKKLGHGIISIFCLLIFGLILLSYKSYGKDDSLQIAVVNIDKLLQAHKNWKDLSEMDKKLQNFQITVKKGQLGDEMKDAQKKFKSLVTEYQKKMQEKNKELTAQWNSQQDTIMSKLQVLQEKYSSIMESNMEPVKSENQQELLNAKTALEAELKRKLDHQAYLLNEKYKPDLEKENKAVQIMLEKYVNTLIVERDKKIQEKRASMELDLQTVLNAERSRLQSRLEEQKQKRLEENQYALLQINLQINKINSQKTFTKEDEDKMNKLISEKETIDQSYQQDITQATRDMEGNFAAFKNKKVDEIDDIISTYEKELNQVMNTKVEAKKKDLDSILQIKLAAVQDKIKEEIKAFQEPLEREYEALIQQKQGEVESSTRQKWESMNSKISSEYDKKKNALIATLSVKQGKLKSELSIFGQKLHTEFEDKKNELEVQYNKKQKEEYDKLAKQRKELFDKIMKDISLKVEKVARPKGISVVITGYWHNISTVDLTNEVLAIMK